MVFFSTAGGASPHRASTRDYMEASISQRTRSKYMKQDSSNICLVPQSLQLCSLKKKIRSSSCDGRASHPQFVLFHFHPRMEKSSDGSSCQTLSAGRGSSFFPFVWSLIVHPSMNPSFTQIIIHQTFTVKTSPGISFFLFCLVFIPSGHLKTPFFVSRSILWFILESR